MLSPTAPMPAFAAEMALARPTTRCGRSSTSASPSPSTCREQPAASINCGYTADGLPIGLQIVGQRFDDLGVLQVARALEAICVRRSGRGRSRPLSTPIAAFTRAGVSGSSRRRTPVASATALAIAAAVGPCAASPVPRKGCARPVDDVHLDALRHARGKRRIG